MAFTLLKVNDRNTRTRREICSKLTISITRTTPWLVPCVLPWKIWNIFGTIFRATLGDLIAMHEKCPNNNAWKVSEYDIFLFRIVPFSDWTRKISVFRHSSQSGTLKNWRFFYHFLICNFYRNGLGSETYLPEISYEEYQLVKSIRFT